MRPERLEMEGFASYREATEIDFGGADLFVLTGPTGSGKSSIIDAMTFALYGAVARYDDPKMVFPVITQGKSEGRVRFDFQVDGESYTAVRVVRRTGAERAATRIARLEKDGAVIADSVKEMDAEVERLLGLPFEHFLKCVVLPQGAFAQFLRDKQSKRQDLLVKLLDLEVYARMAKAANVLHAERAETARRLRQRLDEDLAGATPKARREIQARITALETLVGFVEETAPRLAELEAKRKAAVQRSEEASRQAHDLRAVKPPPADLKLAEEIAAAAAAEETARVELKAAAEAREVAARKRVEPAEAERLRVWQRQQKRRAELLADLERQSAELEALQRSEEETSSRAAAAAASRAKAERALASARRADLAAHLAEGLEPGDECPVCGARIGELPAHPPDEHRAQAEAAVEEAGLAVAKAEAELRASEKATAVCRDRVAARREELDALAEDLAEAPDPALLAERLEAVVEAEKAYADASEREQAAGAEVTRRAARASGLKERRGEAWARLQAVRDPFTALGAPTLTGDDLAAAWRELALWASAEAPRREEAAAAASAEAAVARKKQEGLEAELREAFAGVGLEPGERSPVAVCHEALATARRDLETMDKALAEAREVRAEEKQVKEEAGVAKELGRHLDARHFEAWFLQRALDGLVAVATRLLRELSRGQYSLRFDGRRKEFVVVDHANADEPRLARTLSGGETFLASLSLALALSEQVTRLAARGAARLDAIFLDEGFGTLDTETLDTVAAAIEELGARGHVVGLVTHVSELAERVPVRFEVSKDPRSSRVVRVES